MPTADLCTEDQVSELVHAFYATVRDDPVLGPIFDRHVERIMECFATGGSCMLTGSCGLTGALDGALRKFVEHLDGYTLAGILPKLPSAQAQRPIRMVRAARTGRP
jgi:hypothetical protein